jgi:hypothetical protein
MPSQPYSFSLLRDATKLIKFLKPISVCLVELQSKVYSILFVAFRKFWLVFFPFRAFVKLSPIILNSHHFECERKTFTNNISIAITAMCSDRFLKRMLKMGHLYFIKFR